MDVGGGGVGKASEEMLKELQKTQKQDSGHEAGKASEGHAKFEQTLQNHTQVNEAQNLAKLQEATKTQPSSTLQAAKSGQLNTQIQAQATQKVTPTEQTKSSEPAKTSMFNGVVKELMAGQNKMEGLMKVAMSGQKLSNQEMLGIQAGVYMYSQQMELTSKVIDKATSGIKQAMNTQV